MGLFKKGWLKKATGKAIGLANTVSPLGLVSKIGTGKGVFDQPSVEELQAGAKKSGGILASVFGGKVINDNAMGLLENKGGIIDQLSGNVKFGKDSFTGLVPVILATAVGLLIAFGTGIFKIGKKRRR